MGVNMTIKKVYVVRISHFENNYCYEFVESIYSTGLKAVERKIYLERKFKEIDKQILIERKVTIIECELDKDMDYLTKHLDSSLHDELCKLTETQK